MACVIASSTFNVSALPTVGDDAPRPGVNLAVRIRHLPLGEPRQIGISLCA